MSNLDDDTELARRRLQAVIAVSTNQDAVELLKCIATINHYVSLREIALNSHPSTHVEIADYEQKSIDGLDGLFKKYYGGLKNES